MIIVINPINLPGTNLHVNAIQSSKNTQICTDGCLYRYLLNHVNARFMILAGGLTSTSSCFLLIKFGLFSPTKLSFMRKDRIGIN